MRTRPGVNKTLRSQILKRDGQACRKCGRYDLLDVHHIQAVMDGGSDDPDNLITLCRACHREWELAEMVLTIDFDTWLSLPSYSILIATVMGIKLEASEVYEAAMFAQRMLADTRRLEAIDQYQENKKSRRIKTTKG